MPGWIRGGIFWKVSVPLSNQSEIPEARGFLFQVVRVVLVQSFSSRGETRSPFASWHRCPKVASLCASLSRCFKLELHSATKNILTSKLCYWIGVNSLFQERPILTTWESTADPEQNHQEAKAWFYDLKIQTPPLSGCIIGQCDELTGKILLNAWRVV
jgi:hypothetical protein